jgi:hypothetical protein
MSEYSFPWLTSRFVALRGDRYNRCREIKKTAN